MIGTIPRRCWKIQRLTTGVVGLLDQTVPLPEMSWLHHKLYQHTPRPSAIPVAFQTRTYRLQLATLNKSTLNITPYPSHHIRKGPFDSLKIDKTAKKKGNHYRSAYGDHLKVGAFLTE